MNFAQRIDFASLMEPVATRLLGEPNKRLSKPPKDIRYGNHGSLSIDLTTGRFFDHENNTGGGVVDFVKHQLQCDHGAAVSWIRREGLLPEQPSPPGGFSPKPRPVGSKSPRFVCAYNYVDENAVMLHQTLRYDEPKTFRQRRPHPDKHGEWLWNLDGIRTVLYQLPDLLKAIAGGNAIYIVEGEQDANNLHSLGLAATTNPMGAGKWRPEFSESLRGADAVIIGDNDNTGRKHAEQVATSLYGIAKRVRVLDLAKVWPECPEKGDVSDWIAAGGTAEQMAALIEPLTDWHPSVAYVAYVAPPAIWPTMDRAAYHGLAGDVVHTIEPHTEADPVAVLIQVLIYFGNIVGSAPHYLIEADKHHTNLYGVLVGATSKARKGTSDGRARSVFTEADAQWVEDRIRGGLSSGEGFIDPIRDAVQKWNAKEQQFEVIDPGVTDKRLMVVEAEFAGALTAMERPGNTLSVMVRKAWDGHKLATMTRHSPIKVTAPHVSIIGHSTQDDIRAGLTRTDAANGFANRFMFACIKRSKTLPHGGNLSPETIQALATRIKKAVEHASKAGRLTMTPEARETWEAVYPTLSAGQAGLLGAITARGEAQVIRLSLIYALLDGADHIDVPHLKAALAVWEYCEASAAYIFGNALGDPVADEISIALQHAGRDGMSRTAIRDLFGRHRSSDRVGVALALLVTKGRARVEHQSSAGRPVEMWFASHG
jgi:hypothetical protein